MVFVEARKGAHAIRRKKFRLIQHAAEHALELFTVHEREEPAHAARGALRHFNVFGHVRMIVDEPWHTALEARKAIDDFWLEGLDGEKRDQSYHRADLQDRFCAVGEFYVVI